MRVWWQIQAIGQTARAGDIGAHFWSGPLCLTPPSKSAPVRARSLRSLSSAGDHGISKSFYYKLKKQGRGPAEIKLGSLTMVSSESAARWRRRMEKESPVA